MIALLTGNLVAFDGTRGVLDVCGVGYEVFATQSHLDTWKQADDTVTVHVSTQVREDAIQLYAFPSDDDRKVFLALLGVSGVGPKMALSSLDTLGAEGLAQAVATDDIRALSRISGVGKKTAQRMALDLKGKLPEVAFTPSAEARTPVKAAPNDPLPLALARLGYTKSEIDRARAALERQGIAVDAPVGERLRAALQVLSGGGQ